MFGFFIKPEQTENDMMIIICLERNFFYDVFLVKQIVLDSKTSAQTEIVPCIVVHTERFVLGNEALNRLQV